MCCLNETEISVQNGREGQRKKENEHGVKGEMNGSKKQEEDGTPATSR